MGCICSKEGFGDEFEFVHKHHGKHKETRLSKRSSLGKDKPANEVMGLISESAVEGDKGSTEKASHKDGHKNAMFRVKPLNWHHLKHPTKDHGKITGGQTKMSRIASMPNGDEAANIAAGWPSWLTAVAGNVVSGWAPRRADTFEKLEKIGQGTYSSVYRARDLESGKIVAMKKVRFANMDPESVRFMAREIHILRKLDHPNVMKLECLVTSKVSSSLYLVFEYMEHDLAGLAARPGMKFTESQIKCYMKQLFQGLEHCHSRGVLHRDIKGANLLIDNDGNLKIGDFGLATLFQHSQKQPLTSRVVTLWYRPPELLLGSTDYGVAVDLWSAGCILAELFQGKPIMPGRTEVEQLHKIFKLCGSPSIEYWQKSRLSNATMFKPQRPYTRRLAETFKDFPSPALTLLDVLLHVEPERRGSASLALQSEFFSKKPLPCAPSALPKYPPSKEFDARLRDAEARRQRAAAKGLGQELDKKEGRQNKTGPLLATNPQLEVSTQRHYKLPNPRSNSEKFNWEQAGSGLFIEPSRGLSQNDIAQSFHPLTSNSLSQSCKIQGREDEISTQPGHSSRFHAARRLLKLSRFASSTGLSGGAEVNEQHVSGDDIQPVKQAESNHTVDSQKESNKKDGHTFRKMFSLRRAPVKQLHCSGPLLRADENIDKMLKENEKNIQEAVRKARCDRMRTRKANADN